MEPVAFFYKSKDGARIFGNKWVPDDQEIKGIVQIAHGMAEHSGRYSGFAAELVNAGYGVYANDHRGHGKTAGSKENLGFFAKENGWETVVDDLKELTNLIRNKHAGQPVFLFGHSMGSFLSRRYIQKYGEELAGVILSGTGADPGLLGYVGIGIAKFEIMRKGKRAKSPLLDRLSFGSYNKQFRPTRTSFDWLSRSEEEVDKYMADPFCGGVSTTGFFHDMLTGLKNVERQQHMKKIPKDLPIFLISGDKDPVGGSTKGVLKTVKSFQNTGIKDVTYKFYRDARHEILNEMNKDEVYQDVINWLDGHLSKGGEMIMQNQKGNREQILTQIKDIVLKKLEHHPVQVYLFGSWAREEERRTSDIDIGIWYEIEPPMGTFSYLRETLEGSTIPYNVDVVDLPHADEIILEKVKREGILWKDYTKD